MSETKIVWHPYPQEKPKSARRFYLVTSPDVISNGIDINYFTEFNRFVDKRVIAWAELPEPYKEGNS